MSSRDMLVVVPPKQTIGVPTGNSSAGRLPGGTSREWPKSVLDALGAYPDEIPRSEDDNPQRDPIGRRY